VHAKNVNHLRTLTMGHLQITIAIASMAEPTNQIRTQQEQICGVAVNNVGTFSLVHG
jgi:hypothetical protein